MGTDSHRREHPPLAGADWLTETLEGVREGVLLLSPNHEILFANPAAERMLSIEAAEMVGASASDVLPGRLLNTLCGQFSVGQPSTAIASAVDESLGPVRMRALREGYAIHIEGHPARAERNNAPSELECIEKMAVACDVGLWHAELPLGAEGLILSPEARRHHGIEGKGRLTMQTLVSRLHRDDVGLVREAWRRASQNGEHYDVLYRAIGDDGKIRWVRSSGAVSVDAAGRPKRIDGFAVDLTDRVEAVAAIRESEALHRAMIEHARDVVFTLSLDGVFLYISRAWDRIMGSRAEDAIGSSIRRFLSEDDYRRCMDYIARLLEDPELSETLEYTTFAEDGSLRHISARGAVVLDRDGKPMHLVATAVDITERKRSELALKESERKYRFLADSIPLMVWVCDAQGRPIQANARCRECLDSDATPAGIGHWSTFIHSDDLDGLQTAWRNALATGSEFSHECRVRGADGAFRWHMAMASPELVDGLVAGWVGCSVDIHAQKTRESSLALIASMWQATKGLRDDDAIMRVCTKLLCDHLGVSRCALTEVIGQDSVLRRVAWPPESHTRFVVSSLSEYGPDIYQSLRMGHPTVACDTQNDVAAALLKEAGATSLVAVPLQDDGQLHAVLVVLDDSRREWSAEELGLIQLVAERCWSVVKRARTERALIRSEAQYKQIAEGLPQLVWSALPNGSNDYFNQRWYDYLGLEPGDSDGDRWAKVVHPDDMARTWDQWRHSLRTGDFYEIEYRLLRADGQYRWMLGRAAPIRDESGAIVRWFGTCTEIHEHKLAIQALQASARIGALLTQDLDLERIAQTLADATRELTGAAYVALLYNIDSEDASSLKLCAVSGATIDAAGVLGMCRLTPILAHTFAKQRIVRSDDIAADPRYRDSIPQSGLPNGHLAVRSYLAVPVVSKQGKVIGGLLFGHPEPKVFSAEHEALVASFAAQAALAMRNATLFADVQQANRDLAIARDKALEASKAKGEFLANMSHEIRTPLNGVIGLASLLAESDLPTEAEEIAKTIAASGKTLLRVLDDILDLSRIDAGKVEIVLRPTNLANTFSDIVELFSASAHGKGLELHYHAPEGAIPRVLVDDARLRQILGNLLSNAVKFTERGKVSVVWALSGDGSRKTLWAEVRDTGIGIPPDKLASVFESFTQADGSVQRRFGGTGLGLTISLRLAEMMGGCLDVVSNVGVGSRFVLSLPLDCLDSLDEPKLRDGSARRLYAAKVLVAEDHDVNVIVARKMLERCGCEVEVATDGQRTVELLRRKEFDLVLMDVQMPGIDGLEATRRIRAAEASASLPRVPVIGVSASATPQDHEACLAAGMDGFLPKPYTIDSLRTLLAQWAPGRLPAREPD